MSGQRKKAIDLLNSMLCRAYNIQDNNTPLGGVEDLVDAMINATIEQINHNAEGRDPGREGGSHGG